MAVLRYATTPHVLSMAHLGAPVVILKHVLGYVLHL